MNSAIALSLAVLLWFAGVTLILFFLNAVEQAGASVQAPAAIKSPDGWVPPDLNSVADTEEGRLIRYGRDLIVNTAKYLGPNGKVKAMSNGMACQNCHLDAGTRLYGNNFRSVASTYPKFKPRYGSIESVERRISDCFLRSLNGESLESSGREMRAIVAYILWVGKDVAKGVSPSGSGMVNLPYIDRAASPQNGEKIYALKCAVCHGGNGEGIMNEDSVSWKNPPL